MIVSPPTKNRREKPIIHQSKQDTSECQADTFESVPSQSKPGTSWGQAEGTSEPNLPDSVLFASQINGESEPIPHQPEPDTTEFRVAQARDTSEPTPHDSGPTAHQTIGKSQNITNGLRPINPDSRPITLEPRSITPESASDSPKVNETVTNLCASHISDGHILETNVAGDSRHSEHTNQAQATSPIQCVGCSAVSGVTWCSICDTTLCERCWSLQVAHQNKTGRREHQRMELRFQTILPSIFTAGGCLECDDTKFKWFEVGSKGNVSSTHRYGELSVDAGFDHPRYPALLSFIGDSGTGKSTLIRALMKVYNPILPLSSYSPHHSTRAPNLRSKLQCLEA